MHSDLLQGKDLTTGRLRLYRSQIITLERMLSEREIEIERLRAKVEVLSKTI